MKGKKRLPKKDRRMPPIGMLGGPDDPWARRLDWGPLSPEVDDASLAEEVKRDPWTVPILRRMVEDEAHRFGLDVNGLFHLRRADAQDAVDRLASEGVLCLEECEAIAMLLLIVTCRDPLLPETGRRHAMGLFSSFTLSRLEGPGAPTAAVVMGGLWEALRSLHGAGVLDISDWTPGQVKLDGVTVKTGEYQPLVMTPHMGPGQYIDLRRN